MVKVLSVKPAAAWLLLTGRKDVENRTWSTGWRGRVAIQASNLAEQGDSPAFQSLLKELSIEVPVKLSVACLVGELFLQDCFYWPSPKSLSPWEIGPWCWQFSPLHVYSHPIPFPNQTGLVELPDLLVTGKVVHLHGCKYAGLSRSIQLLELGSSPGWTHCSCFYEVR